MINAYEAYMLMPSTKWQMKKYNEILKNVEEKIIEAANHDKNKIEVWVPEKYKPDVLGVLNENNYDYDVLNALFDPTANERMILICIRWP